MTQKAIWIIFSLKSTNIANILIIKQRVIRSRVDNTWDEDQQFDLDIWTCDLKINRGHLLSKGIYCTKFGNSTIKGVKRYWVDYIFAKTSSLALTFGHVIWKLLGVIYLLGASIIPSLATFRQRLVKRFRADIFSKTSSLTLTFDHVTWKLMRVIYSLGYGSILLPSTCKKNYVNMQHIYVNMRLIYVNMQHSYVHMQHNYVHMRLMYLFSRMWT